MGGGGSDGGDRMGGNGRREWEKSEVVKTTRETGAQAEREAGQEGDGRDMDLRENSARACRQMEKDGEGSTGDGWGLLERYRSVPYTEIGPSLAGLGTWPLALVTWAVLRLCRRFPQQFRASPGFLHVTCYVVLSFAYGG